MNITRKSFLSLASCALLFATGCTGQTEDQSQDTSSSESPEPALNLSEFKALELKRDGWKFDKVNNCFYQLGIPYCLHPASKTYGSLSIYVPGTYFLAKQKGDSWQCTTRDDAQLGGYTPQTAPIVMPLNSAFFTPQACPNVYEYEGMRRYLQAGMIYVYAGFRGRSSGFESDKKEMFSGGAPWSVVDLKSAIRFLRYNASALPANTDNIFTLSYGAGATISSVLGSSGDSDLYTSYLKKVGAATHDSKGNTISDKIAGCALWCPLLDAELGDCAYEWMMGQFVTDESRKANSFKKQLSSDLAQEYAARLNELGLCDNQNERLLLSKLDDGSYCDGSYYNYVMKTLTDAATDFITHTQFPYVQTPSRLMEPAFPGNLNEKCVSSTTKEPESSSSSAQDGSKQKLSEDPTASDKTSTGVSKVQGTSYETPSSYLASLNSDTRWITYSSSKGTVTISNLWEFVKHCKIPNKAVCAFDALDKSTPSNQLFGVDNESTLHFDAHVAHLLAEHQDAYKKDSAFDTKLVDAYRNDLDKKDSLGSSQQLRINALNPLYNLCGSSEGFGKAQVAPFWRINTGLMQQASPLTTELNLVAALKHYDGVKDVQFTPVWDKGFELAEVKGHPQDNAIQWVSTCIKQLSALQEQKEQQEQDEQSQDDSSD